MKRYAIHLDDFCSVPGDTECHAMIWSDGRNCRKCGHAECYRQGWLVARVRADNERRVREKNRSPITQAESDALGRLEACGR